MKTLLKFSEFSDLNPNFIQLDKGTCFYLIDRGQKVGKFEIIGYSASVLNDYTNAELYYSIEDLMSKYNIDNIDLSNIAHLIEELEVQMVVKNLETAEIGPLLNYQNGKWQHPYLDSYKIKTF